MNSWFDELTKFLANDKLSRRQIMRRAAGTVAGVLLTSVLPGQVLALGQHPSKHTCQNPFTCNGNYYLCGSNEYADCYCFTNPAGTGTCGCDTYCQNTKPCLQNTDCSKRHFCAIGTCCPGDMGVCLPKCTKTCRLDANGVGMTAAHR